uniref:Uncharacterized protein n=1 Tax=Anguilla anguilla TaxID=7936 RepID=A0A0E9U7E8_ANGAN
MCAGVYAHVCVYACVCECVCVYSSWQRDTEEFHTLNPAQRGVG